MIRQGFDGFNGVLEELANHEIFLKIHKGIKREWTDLFLNNITGKAKINGFQNI